MKKQKPPKDMVEWRKDLIKVGRKCGPIKEGKDVFYFDVN